MDTVPHIPAAGYKPPVDNNSTAACVQPDLDPAAITQLNATLSSFTLQPASSTPSATLAAIDPHYKYRRTFQTQPGLRFIHPGLTHQPATHSPHIAHGIATKQTLTAADVLASSLRLSLVLSARPLHSAAEGGDVCVQSYGAAGCVANAGSCAASGDEGG